MMLAKSLQSAAGNAAGEANYIEDVFSTWLYTGNGSTQTINNGIDLAGEGGLVWIKDRSATTSHGLFDTARGVNNYLSSNSANEQNVFGVVTNALTAFNSNGFSVGTSLGWLNASGDNIASWTFRKAPKFFDVVTWTGDGVNGRQIAHSLGSTPGCVIVKCTNNATRWATWHRSLTAGSMLTLDLTNAEFAISGSAGGGVSSADSSTFTVSTGSSLSWVNASGSDYVAYLFAHDAGGFGLSGTDNVISCGSYTGNGSASGQNITLGYEPQWLLVKGAVGTGTSWYMLDNMRGITTGGNDPRLQANQADAEFTSQNFAALTATGFQVENDNIINLSGTTYIYIAIRRGPMKVPESGTSVFAPVAYAGDGTSTQVVTTGFPVDAVISFARNGSSVGVHDRLRGSNRVLYSDLTASEGTDDTNITDGTNFDRQTGLKVSTDYNQSSALFVLEAFRRAPGFMDVVCYNSNGIAGTQIPHNLGVKPQLMIVKCRNNAIRWVVYAEPLGATQYLVLNTDTFANTNIDPWNNTEPTASVFTVEDGTQSNAGFGYTYVAYLFASCPGVSKVGSYTGTAATLQIDCGFTTGARFVLIKRTDSTGNWYVWDSARGIVAGNDPYLLLNSTAAEVTSTDYIDPVSSGFEISSTAPAAINASGGSFIFLAIA